MKKDTRKIIGNEAWALNRKRRAAHRNARQLRKKERRQKSELF